MYGKLFSSMFDGTLATRGPWQALVTFEQLVILADRHGIVDMTPEAISRRTTIPIEIITKGLAALEQPDPESRSPDEEGRRIVRLSDTRPWGWRVVNHTKYRAMRTEEDRREYMRAYQRKRRAAQAAGSADVNRVNRRKQSQPIAVSSRQEALKPPPTKVDGAGKGSKSTASTKREAGTKQRTPVSECFQRYQAGIKAKTGATYPPSAKANGQLAQLVKRVGAEHAPAVVDFYLASTDSFYAKTGWKLDFLVRDAEQLYLAVQGASGHANGPASSDAVVELITTDGCSVPLRDYPAGEPLEIARKARADYEGLIAYKHGRSIAVRIGARRNVYQLEELS